MKINLLYNHYANSNVSSEEYFKQITNFIGLDYPHTVSDIKIIYYPIDFEDLEKEKSKGYQIIYKQVGLIEQPHYVIRQICITFLGQNKDFEQDVAHLIEMFGEKAFKWQAIEEGIIKYDSE